jgi:anthranilate phosphoribosyltransferase
MIGVLRANGAERALVVYGHDGLDELTVTTTSTVLELRDGDVRNYVVNPVALGIDVSEAGTLKGGDAATNAASVRRVFDGEKGPHRDFALLNAAAGLVASGLVDDLADGLVAAAASIDDGRAAAVLTRLIEVSQREAEQSPTT